MKLTAHLFHQERLILASRTHISPCRKEIKEEARGPSFLSPCLPHPLSFLSPFSFTPHSSLPAHQTHHLLLTFSSSPTFSFYSLVLPLTTSCRPYLLMLAVSSLVCSCIHTHTHTYTHYLAFYLICLYTFHWYTCYTSALFNSLSPSLDL